MNASLPEIIRCVFVLVAIGLALWVVNSKVPMESTIKVIMNVVVCLAVLVWVLRFFGAF